VPAKQRPKRRRKTDTLFVPTTPGGVSVDASEAEPKRLTAVGNLYVSGNDPTAQGAVAWGVNEALHWGRSMVFRHPVTVTPAGSDPALVKVEEVSS